MTVYSVYCAVTDVPVCCEVEVESDTPEGACQGGRDQAAGRFLSRRRYLRLEPGPSRDPTRRANGG